MTPKEKAKELIESFSFSNRYNLEKDGYFYNINAAKESAHICVNEILNAITFNMYDEDAYNKEDIYWEQVKQEIENL